MLDEYSCICYTDTYEKSNRRGMELKMTEIMRKFIKLIQQCQRKKNDMTSMQKIIVGYAFIILVGTLLLALPFSTRSGAYTSVSDALFTATSATCVTGLVRFDTYIHWSLFGQIIILSMIQIGGIGFMTIAVSVISMTRRRISIASREIMQDSIASPYLGGLVGMTRFILMGTAMIEGAGAILLSFYFCPRLGTLKGIWYSVFHSISAFCNAGFDLFGTYEPYSSLTSASANWYVNLIVIALIVIGGLGFFVWRDLLASKFRFGNLKLHSKMVLSVTVVLVIGGAIVLFLLEQGSEAFAGLTVSNQIVGALFQSVTARTAGFNTINLSAMSQAGQFFMIVLMLIGGSPGSTAGGMKTTTAAVLFLSIHSTLHKRRDTEAFGRRLGTEIVRTSCCILMLYLLAVIVSTMLISHIDNLPLLTSMYECVSAVATVGVTLGITAELSMISKLIIIALMFFGRVGSITILLAFSSDKGHSASKLPIEKMQVG